MIKKSISILSLLFLLAACSQGDTNKPVENEKETETNDIVTLPETDEESNVETDSEDNIEISTNLFEEEFWNVIGDAKIKKFPITLGASYEETKEKMGQPKEEFNMEGGLCADYEDFIICKADDKDEILYFTSKIPNKVTIEDFKGVLGEPDSADLIEHPYTAYRYSYGLGDTTIFLDVLSGDSKGNIDEITALKFPQQ
ncbi:hypothetical protein ACIQYS_12305 [Psychrobacillus sp. NPDC096426]|uniref:hypothetical protein n=1 Tax=Psychrobacillus sp. NPDC096426 TaxID=3364491 RepID=UPI003821DD2C